MCICMCMYARARAPARVFMFVCFSLPSSVPITAPRNFLKTMTRVFFL